MCVACGAWQQHLRLAHGLGRGMAGAGGTAVWHVTNAFGRMCVRRCAPGAVAERLSVRWIDKITGQRLLLLEHPQFWTLLALHLPAILYRACLASARGIQYA